MKEGVIDAVVRAVGQSPRSAEMSSVAAGPHSVTLTLRQRHPQLASDLVLTDVEFVVGA